MSHKQDVNAKDAKQEWVQFDDEGHEIAGDDSPAVLDTQAVQVTLENNRTNVEASATSPSKNIPRIVPESANGAVPLQQTTLSGMASNSVQPHVRETTVEIPTLNPAHLQNVPLSDQTILGSRPQIPSHSETPVIRQGFVNGDVIVTILPQNSSLPWITPAKFRPELVPEELMAHGLTLTVEDYVHVMTQLVNDHRFTMYNICYKRVLMAWITLAFIILLCILFANFQHLVKFGAGIAWLMVNAGAIFFCMWIKMRLNKNLERCVSRINLQLMKHKILLGLDDRGKISCHKINLCFIYFDPHECLVKLQKLIDQDDEAARAGNRPNNMPSLSERFDVEDPDIIIAGATNTRVNQQQYFSRNLFARYSQRWIKLIVRGGLSLGIDASDRSLSGCNSIPPRHMSTRQCPCQYIEDHLQYKPQGTCSICSQMAEFIPEYRTT